LSYLQQQQLRAPVLELGLDGTFDIAVRDEARATRWLRRIGAEEGKFLCELPRLRYTPYIRCGISRVRSPTTSWMPSMPGTPSEITLRCAI
jgi:hypothetical protein